MKEMKDGNVTLFKTARAYLNRLTKLGIKSHSKLQSWLHWRQFMFNNRFSQQQEMERANSNSGGGTSNDFY